MHCALFNKYLIRVNNVKKNNEVRPASFISSNQFTSCLMNS